MPEDDGDRDAEERAGEQEADADAHPRATSAGSVRGGAGGAGTRLEDRGEDRGRPTTPRRLRSRSTTSRWARTGWTSALTSSGRTNDRPARTAAAWAARYSATVPAGWRRARGRGGRGSPGRARRGSASTSSLTRTRRTSSRRAIRPGPSMTRLDGVERLAGGLVAAGDRPLIRLGRVAEAGPQQEPVELGLRQRERAFELDRVLGREDDERVGQGAGRALDRDLALLHRLEQRGLGPRRGPVDLVDEQDVGEHRARRRTAACRPRTGWSR